MSRFVSKKPIKIDLSEDEHVEIQKLSYGEFVDLSELINTKEDSSHLKFGIALLKKCICGWNLKDDDGNDVEFTSDKVEDLEVPTIIELTEKVQEYILPEKKS